MNENNVVDDIEKQNNVKKSQQNAWKEVQEFLDDQGDKSSKDPIFANPNHLNKKNSTESKFIKKNSELFDSDAPASIELAIKHGMANRVGENIIRNENNSIEHCKCCNLPVENDLLNLCADRAEFSVLGPGFPLYFETVLICIFLLLIMFIIFGIYALEVNYNTDDCFDDPDLECNKNFITFLSLYNKSNDKSLFKTQSWIILGTIIVLQIFFQLYRRYQILTEREAVRGLITAANYTVMIDNMIDNKLNSDKILDFINTNCPSNQFVIKKIVLGYHISDFISKTREKNEINNKIRNYIRIKKNGVFPKNIDSKLELLNQDITRIKQELVVFEESTKFPCGTAFITFETMEMADNFIQRFEFTYNDYPKYYLKSFLCCFKNKALLQYNENTVYIEKAKEPNDILWENLGFDNKEKLKKRFKTFAATLLVLVVCFALIFSISIGKTKIVSDYSEDTRISVQFGIRILTASSSILIVFVNSCLLLIIKKFATLEKHSSITHFSISIARSLTFAYFFNTAIIMFLVHYVIDDKLGKADGLIADIFSVFLANTVIPPAMNFFDIFYLLRLRKQSEIRKNPILFTQIEANLAFEGPALDMWKKYPGIIKTMLVTAFYAPLIPISIIISVFALFISYWTEKYLILRRMKRPPFISSDLNNEMMNLLELFPLFFAVGNIIFNELLSNNRDISDRLPDILCLVFGGFTILFPSAQLTLFIWKLPEDIITEITYDNIKKNFLYDYDKSNPVTQENAEKAYIDELKEKGLKNQAIIYESIIENKKGLDLYAAQKAEKSFQQKSYFNSFFKN